MSGQSKTRRNRKVAILSPKFKISVPKAIRDAQNWKPGQQFVCVPNGNSLILTPIPTIEDLRGIARGADPEGYRDRDDRY
jgi:bifunctional DNA-binding transcriptional regulator/antitoxin component of YhaV-PrlF toxin-antitoxin module